MQWLAGTAFTPGQLRDGITKMNNFVEQEADLEQRWIMPGLARDLAEGRLKGVLFTIA